MTPTRTLAQAAELPFTRQAFYNLDDASGYTLLRALLELDRFIRATPMGPADRLDAQDARDQIEDTLLMRLEAGNQA